MQDYNVLLALKVGKDFHFSDVELLCFHLKKQWKSKKCLNIYCLYDKVSSIIKLKDCTLLPMYNNEWPGWWCKMNLFAPQLKKYRPFLFFDLDTAIVGDIIDLFPNEENENKLINLIDFYKGRSVYANGVMWVPANNEKVEKIWDVWVKNPKGYMKTYKKGDMWFMNAVVPTDLFWQDLTDKISSFKPRVDRMVQYLKILPENISVVCFHGKPRMRKAKVEWVVEYVYHTQLNLI